MQQLISTLLSLLLIAFLMYRKLSSGLVLFIAAAFAGIVGGLSIPSVGLSFLHVFTQWDNLSSVLIVVEIAMLGSLMTQRGLFGKAETAIKAALPFPRLIIMLMPSLIGMLQVPGGAALSAPFCNSLGQEMGLSPAKRANTNVICRHVFMLFAPFSTCVIMVVTLAPQLELWHFLLPCFIFTAVMVAGNYIFFLRDCQQIRLPRLTTAMRAKNLGRFLLNLSPIWLAVALNIVLKLSYVFAIPIALIPVLLLGGTRGFLQDLIESFKPGLAFMIVGVYFFQNVIKEMDDLQTLVSSFLANGSLAAFMTTVAAAAALFGLASGLMYTPLGVLVPIVAGVSPTPKELVANLFFLFCWSYIGYFFSPLHMCQILSDRECGCTIGDRYRTYLPILLLLPLCSIGIFLICRI